MSWFWMAFFLILSAVAVGVPFLLPEAGAAAGFDSSKNGSSLRRRLQSSLRELDLDLAAGKIGAGDHAAARAALEEELRALDGASPSRPGPGGAGA